jgi:hypothetical protein
MFCSILMALHAKTGLGQHCEFFDFDFLILFM